MITDRPIPHIIAEAVAADWQREAMGAVRELGLPDCWISAGFVRNAVWDYLHGYSAPTPLNDIDVIYFEALPEDAYDEQALEQRLTGWLPQYNWQVRNQARMHKVNGFPMFVSCEHAMTHWVETPTAIGLALDGFGRMRINAPLGVFDLLGMYAQPGPYFTEARRHVFRKRMLTKRWPETWPKVRVLGM